MLSLNSTNLSFVFTLDEKTVVFPLKIVNKRNLVMEDQETYLNDYLDYKGYAYKKELFILLYDVHTEITLSSTNKDLVLIKGISKLIDFIDIVDIKHYFIEVKKIKIPKNLVREFTKEMKEDGRWTEEQTFTVEDYKNLAAEAIRLKMLLGPLNYYYYVNSNKFTTTNVEYRLVNILLKKILSTSLALTKVRAMILKIIAGIDYKAVIIDKKLPADQLSEYVSCIIMLQRIATATLIRDNEDKNVITTIYSYGYNKLTISGDISKIIRDKIPVSKEEAETASVIEGYKAVTLVTPGDIEKVLWVTDDILFMLQNSPQYLIDNVTVKNLPNNAHKLDIFKDDNISYFTKMVTKLIFKKTINQMAQDHLKIKNIMNQLIVGYEFLTEIGYNNIAELYIAREIDFTNFSINPIKKKDKALMAKLENIYLNTGETFINNLVDSLMVKNWVNYNGPVRIPDNIINELANLMLDIEENYNKE